MIIDGLPKLSFCDCYYICLRDKLKNSKKEKRKKISFNYNLCSKHAVFILPH